MALATLGHPPSHGQLEEALREARDLPALAGCALVLGDVPSLRETWEGAALFVTPGDPVDLRRALDLLISEPKGLRGLAQRARTRALLLSPERRAAAFLEAYADLVASGKPQIRRTLEAS